MVPRTTSTRLYQYNLHVVYSRYYVIVFEESVFMNYVYHSWDCLVLWRICAYGAFVHMIY